MPAGPRPTARPGAGPGRGRARSRPPARPPAEPEPRPPAGPAAAGAEPASPATGPSPRPAGEASAPGATPGRAWSRPNLTGRAIALVVVLLILVISYASSLRVYFAQAEEIASTRSEIAEREARIAELRAERERWDDPDFVRTQARDRLGWVVPGEIGYRVVGPDGQPLGGGAAIESGPEPAAPAQAWWTKLARSVESADRVKVEAPRPKQTTPPDVSVSTRPTPAPATPR